jgi:hypothetical protein
MFDPSRARLRPPRTAHVAAPTIAASATGRPLVAPCAAQPIVAMVPTSPAVNAVPRIRLSAQHTRSTAEATCPNPATG